MASDPFDQIMSSLDPPMAIVTTAIDGERDGCLVGFHAQCSIDPHRYAVWLSKANRTYRLALRATHVAVHLLTDADRDLAVAFGTISGDAADKLAGVTVEDGPGGVPLLTACPHRIVLRRTALLDEGSDHVCLVGEPVEVSSPGTFTPLRLADVDDLSPGHEADEHP